ncbi:MAG: ferrochelatase [Campylobacteraceae bacterium]|nr:ferrochelatase [Campylobacteraceae bacterium]
MKKALILLNMGGPNNLDEVKVFLDNMFNDPYILGIKNEKLRSFVAKIITTLRVKPATSNYKQIGDKSPIVEITQSLVDKISAKTDYDVDFIMRYTPPFASDVLHKYKNYDEIVFLPLYPHHSITTVKSSVDDAKREYQNLGMSAKVRVIDVFYKNEKYNNLQLNLIKDKIKGLSEDEISDTSLIFSAHSMPESTIKKGDLYQKHKEEHVEILTKMLEKEGIFFKEVKLAYQSRLGPVKWLGPNLSFSLPLCVSKKALIVPLSFCIDNSETIYELDIEYREVAKENNFKWYEVCKCPNDSDEFVEFILSLV